jgi:hypothetical protein
MMSAAWISCPFPRVAIWPLVEDLADAYIESKRTNKKQQPWAGRAWYYAAFGCPQEKRR